jgi:gluconolactonase
VRDPRALDLLDADAQLETLAEGCTFTEGPVWVAGDDPHLLFSDVPADRRLRWDERGGARVVAQPTGLGNGMTIGLDGRLVVCEGANGRVVAMDLDGTGTGVQTLAGAVGGRRLNSPNDVVVRSDRSVWFTDSWWPPRLGRPMERELDLQGVYRVVAGGEPELVLGDMDFPNGLCFSPDERLLYVNDSTPGRIAVLDVAPDGRASGERTLVSGVTDATGHVDGMKCDARGNLWVTGPGGIWVLDPAGVLLAVVRTPARTGNLHWGGPSWDWLFVACSSGLYRLRTRVGGRREPFMR